MKRVYITGIYVLGIYIIYTMSDNTATAISLYKVPAGLFRKLLERLKLVSICSLGGWYISLRLSRETYLPSIYRFAF